MGNSGFSFELSSDGIDEYDESFIAEYSGDLAHSFHKKKVKNEEGKNLLVVGIDLGTTNSLLSIYKDKNNSGCLEVKPALHQDESNGFSGDEKVIKDRYILEKPNFYNNYNDYVIEEYINTGSNINQQDATQWRNLDNNQQQKQNPVKNSGKKELFYAENELENHIEIVSQAPSIVSYLPDGSPIVGDEAIKNPNCLRSIKRLMGLGINDIKSRKIPYIAKSIDIDSSDSSIIRLKCNDGKMRTPIEISADILSHLKKDAEKKLGQKITDAIITVPAYFDDAARSATRTAAQIAGFNVLRLINEPTAAAIAYGLLKEKTQENDYFAVYDLGGGTFDISILRMYRGVLEVFATGGINQLGGDDFDQILASHYGIEDIVIARIIKELLTNIEVISLDNVDNIFLNVKIDNGKRVAAIEVIKDVLLKRDRIRSKEDQNRKLDDNNEYESSHEEQNTISIKELKELWTPLVHKTLAVTQTVLDDAGISIEEVSEVIMVGGATRMPIVQEMVNDFFVKKPRSTINPDEAVAIGAGIQAHSLCVSTGMLLLDVTPLTLGIEVEDGLVDQIIMRNTPIPAIVRKSFAFCHDDQQLVKIHVVQGESQKIEECRSLAKFSFHCQPKCKKDRDRIDITFCLDSNGIMTVTAQERRGGVPWGQIKEISVKPSYGLDAETIESIMQERRTCDG